ncbi:MAG: right-handed parallel beta-helix repeat-containing protein [Saprospiraceae bacterium]|nr:right-handed parallel beta-helix repeat-containing protein [Saprospiraceae bacterium]
MPFSLKSTLLLFIIIIPLIIFSQSIDTVDALVSPKIARQAITVGGENALIKGFNNHSIQFAIDALSKTGGTVTLNPGIYEIFSPVRLASNIILKGSGKETVLKRAKGVQTKYIVDADYGELKLTVEDARGFQIGMKVQITDDDNSGCWDVSTAYITDIAGNTLYLDKGLIRDYRADKHGLVSNASSVIDVIDAENASVIDLTVDGNRTENYFADGCNNAGIMILRSRNIKVDQVNVKDFNGEGISWQITEHVSIRNSEISGSGNTGLHPGTGSPFSVIENNNVHHNDQDGLFICWRVYQSEVKDNQFHNNGRFGICTGHKDTDVTFFNNHVFENKSDGIHLRGERAANAPHRNKFIKNLIENNGTEGGGYGFSINSPAEELILENNIFKNSQKTQKAAIYIYEPGIKPILENNTFEDHQMGEVVFEKP